MSNYNDKVYLSQAQLETLANGGSVTGGGVTYTGDENVVYLVPKALVIPSAPTTDGTYVLKVTVASGVATCSWVAET